VSKIPVLLLTAREDVDRIVGLEIGRMTISEAFNPRRAGGANPRDPAAHQAGDQQTEYRNAELGAWSWIRQRQCGRAGQPVDLTSVEFNLLEVLLRERASRDAGAVVNAVAQRKLCRLIAALTCTLARCGGNWATPERTEIP